MFKLVVFWFYVNSECKYFLYFQNVKVELRRDMLPLSSLNVQEADNSGMVPVGINTQPSMMETNRRGNLEVSKQVIEFPATRVGKTSEQTITISNMGSDTFRWMFTAFAPTYLQKVGFSTMGVGLVEL